MFRGGRVADIAVIVVNYGAADLALEAVGSALAQDVPVEVHLVDNASPGGDAARLEAEIAARGWAGRVTLYKEAENHGFGRGNNVALRRLAARPDPPRYVMLQNPDATLKPGALAALQACLDVRPEVAVAGAAIVAPDGAPASSAFRFPGLASVFERAAAFGPVSRLLRRRVVALPPDGAEGPVDWVSGAAMMARMEALATAGFFDPAYFLYYEEVDLMRRLARAGWRTWHVPGAQAVHIEGATTDVKSGRAERRRMPAYWYDSFRIYFHRNHGRAAALAATLLWMLGDALNHVVSRLRGRAPAGPLFARRDLWNLVARPLLGLKARHD